MSGEQGIKFEYIPPYSPDFNPIEEAFAELKQWLKKHYEAGDFTRKCQRHPIPQHGESIIMMYFWQEWFFSPNLCWRQWFPSLTGSTSLKQPSWRFLWLAAWINVKYQSFFTVIFSPRLLPIILVPAPSVVTSPLFKSEQTMNFIIFSVALVRLIFQDMVSYRYSKEISLSFHGCHRKRAPRLLKDSERKQFLRF